MKKPKEEYEKKLKSARSGRKQTGGNIDRKYGTKNTNYRPGKMAMSGPKGGLLSRLKKEEK
tara:strand:- start:252 stop:434 length:183 start_codon:yes stop_codon:yes gene_type:complete